MRSIIKYPGSKFWLALKSQKLIDNLKPKSCAEPFCGSLAFSLYHEFQHVVANDLISQLIGFYRQTQGGNIPDISSWDLSDTFYYQARKRFNELNDAGLSHTKEAADIFFYLNKHCYNGLVRFNLSNQFNVPFGLYKKIAEPKGFKEFSEVTKSWEFSSGCFSKTDVSNVDLCLLDPPYADTFNNYSGQGFTFEQQIEVADWASEISCPSIICNSPNKMLAKEYKKRGFKIYRTRAPRSINSDPLGRNGAVELIAFKGFGPNEKFAQLVDGVEAWRV